MIAGDIRRKNAETDKKRLITLLFSSSFPRPHYVQFSPSHSLAKKVKSLPNPWCYIIPILSRFPKGTRNYLKYITQMFTTVTMQKCLCLYLCVCTYVYILFQLISATMLLSGIGLLQTLLPPPFLLLLLLIFHLHGAIKKINYLRRGKHFRATETYTKEREINEKLICFHAVHMVGEYDKSTDLIEHTFTDKLCSH